MSHNSHIRQHPLAMPRRVTHVATKTCSKRRYSDEITAKLELARFQRIDDPTRSKTPCRVYHCPDCGGWHLTSVPLMKRTPRSECGKAAYRTQEEAETNLAWIREHPHTEVVPIRTYECKKCLRWHLSSKPLKKDRGPCGKVGWLYEDMAKAALHRIQENPDPRRRSPVGTHYCGECQRWHLTF